MIEVTVIVRGYLVDIFKKDQFVLKLAPGSSIRQAVDALKRSNNFNAANKPEHRELEDVQMFFILNSRPASEKDCLSNGDTLKILPPVAGG